MYKFLTLEENMLKEMAKIQLDAYPAMALQGLTPEQYGESIWQSHNLPNMNYQAVYRGEKMVGGFGIWDFEMNMRQAIIKAGGIGMVAVDLCSKKEKICFEMMKHFFEEMRTSGTNIALLYPFNSAFYHKMGFGFGTLLQQFRLRPSDLPSNDSKAHIVRLTERDAQMLALYYNSKVKTTHGLMKKDVDEFESRLKHHTVKIFAYFDKDQIQGYMACSFKKGSEESFLVNDMIVNEMFFDHPEVFLELMTFLKSQADQVRNIIINTQDEGFIYTLADPRNQTERILFSVYQECCQTGLGMMYRICDVSGLFAELKDCRFGNLNMKVQLNVNDNLVPENNKAFLLEFTDGCCLVVNDDIPDVEIGIDIAELSSLVMGCTNLKLLVKYGKAYVSDVDQLDELNRGFYLDEKPICTTHF